MQGMGEFLNEMAVMMSQTKSNVSLCFDSIITLEMITDVDTGDGDHNGGVCKFSRKMGKKALRSCRSSLWRCSKETPRPLIIP